MLENEHGLDCGESKSHSPIPLPPWQLTGSAIATLEKVRLNSGVLFPFALRALVHYDSSPVGAYDEFAIIALTNRGLSVVEMFVNSEDAMIGGRRGWGFPKQLAHLSWRQRGARIEFQLEEKIVRFLATRIWFRLSLRGFVIQQLNGENVRVPVKIRGHARIAFHGKQIALMMEGFEMQVLPPQGM